VSVLVSWCHMATICVSTGVLAPSTPWLIQWKLRSGKDDNLLVFYKDFCRYRRFVLQWLKNYRKFCRGGQALETTEGAEGLRSKVPSKAQSARAPRGWVWGGAP